MVLIYLGVEICFNCFVSFALCLYVLTALHSIDGLFPFDGLWLRVVVGNVYRFRKMCRELLGSWCFCCCVEAFMRFCKLVLFGWVHMAFSSLNIWHVFAGCGWYLMHF